MMHSHCFSFQSTLPARGATPFSAPFFISKILFQSTLPARGATVTATSTWGNAYISIHAPREGSDGLLTLIAGAADRFQSTLPARGATSICSSLMPIPLNFNPRSPRGERHSSACSVAALRRFQSTLPARGATNIPIIRIAATIISIHAPREGSDAFQVYFRSS